MDPITIATVTSALSFLGTEIAKGAAGEAGKSAWKQVRKLFGWTTDPTVDSLAPTIAQKLVERPDLIDEIVKLLKSSDQNATAAQLVGSLYAEKVNVIQNMTGTINM